MTIQFVDSFLPAASINQLFSTSLAVTGGTAPYSFALISGTMPPGLVLSNSGLISGKATTLGLYTIQIEASDAAAATVTRTFEFQVLDLIELQNSTVDQAQFVQQFEDDLSATGGPWTTGLTTETSQTLIELGSAVGTFATAKIDRGTEDAFPATAQSDSAIRNIAIMQGLRLSRKLPAVEVATLTSTVSQTIGPFSQFSGGGYSWFTFEAHTFVANVPQTVNLRQGIVVTKTVSGLGTDFQTWVSPENGFVVSDQDVKVNINGADVKKILGAMWNYPGLSAVTDSTMNDGRMMLQFGANGYGAIPGVNDIVTITYATTEGASINGLALAGTSVSGSSVANITGTFTAAASGGADEKPVVAYKNFAAGSFGTYSSAVTKAQYAATVMEYPGIIDAVTQAQREINPTALKWMNVIRVSALTSSTWTQPQIDEFLAYMQANTMYSTRFVFQPPTQIVNDVSVNVYCFNSVSSLSDVQAKVSTAITNLFAPRPGILMTDFFPSDIDDVIKNSAPGQISYYELNAPAGPMIVTTPLSPKVVAHVNGSGGSLAAQVYNYAIAAEAPSPNVRFMGIIDAINNPPWPNCTIVGQYWIIRQGGRLGGPSGTVVNPGDKILGAAIGSSGGDFFVAAYGLHSSLDVGTPVNWVNPQVALDNSSIGLDWSNNPTPNAVFYHIWGRNPATGLGVVATVTGDFTAYLDTGASSVTPAPINVSDISVRYNALGNLTVNVFYSTRQSAANLPIRDSSQ